MSDGWTDSAAAWIADMGEQGDWGRKYVLDPPMIERVRAAGASRALDVGCGEGRFCRMMRAAGVPTVGLDPTLALIEQARRRDPQGDYRVGRAEALDFEDGAFDMVVSYLSLIDIPDIGLAIPEMVRVLKPGGRLLIANLTGFNTAGQTLGWRSDPHGAGGFQMDHYMDERAEWVAWRGIRIQNWHRPLGTYMGALLAQGLTLTHFSEPPPVGADAARTARYRRAPWFLMMEWEKPEALPSA